MIRVALHHESIYRYDRRVDLGPQVVRLRPAPHCRTVINSYSLHVEPEQHFINWQQDPHSNYLARLVFQEPTERLSIVVDLVAEMTVINPFDFFLESSASEIPFEYERELRQDLTPFLEVEPLGPELQRFVESIDRRPKKTIDFLVDLNSRISNEIKYLIRLEPGIQTPEQTLSLKSGSCRDSAWLLVQVLRRLGLAARFVSGYLIQLKPDVDPLEGPRGAEQDFTDLHAWTEVFLPGAGWVGLDPTSGLLAGEGHIPVAATPSPAAAAPISGSVSQCEVDFSHSMSVKRIHEDARVTKPYSESQWRQIDATGQQVDARLDQLGVQLTMGGEPTFVSIDDMDGDEWTTAAVGPTKQRLASQLIDRLSQRFAPNGLIHYGQGKWYPGESLPRWAYTCLWRSDGERLWKNRALLASPDDALEHDEEDAGRFGRALASRLGVDASLVQDAYEDTFYYLWKEGRLPADVQVTDADLEDEELRQRLSRVFGEGLLRRVGCFIPLQHQWWNAQPRWASGIWPVRGDRVFLIPGDSPMGLRLPLESLPGGAETSFSPHVPFSTTQAVVSHDELWHHATAIARDSVAETVMQGRSKSSEAGAGHVDRSAPSAVASSSTTAGGTSATGHVIRTALCLESRRGVLHVFMPPVETLEGYLELLTAIEVTATELETPVVIEGYLPPSDYRIRQLKVTPDPGVIEVNVQPAADWRELVEITEGIYHDARLCRLGTEKFDIDGTHVGTGGGNHVVLGASTPESSPFLRRPDLLRSLVAFWHNHPSLSYVFSGRFIGPTSQAPRVDEGRRDAIYELKLAFEQIPEDGPCPPWLVDRVFRNLLVDITGNTHRAEFCIDKLYSPDSVTGRLGLVELRGFEMPPHWQMSAVQLLLIRAIVAAFWERPYREPLTDWGTTLHDRWMLPYFLQHDLWEVLDILGKHGIALERSWFAPHIEFRFPLIGELECEHGSLELRTAIEPWYVLGEEPSGGGTTRYVDSSVERLQVRIRNLAMDRYCITCNGRRVPLHFVGTRGELVGGVRYRAWQPPSCLHPTIPVSTPLVFDIYDRVVERSLGGCTYHVEHPGGLNPGDFPVNSYEAESRRAARFSASNHTPGPMPEPPLEHNPEFPHTLDLRRSPRAF